MTAELVLGRAGEDPVLELALAESLLADLAAGRHGALVRCYRPLATVAFGRLDTLQPGFTHAAAAARRHGFAPVIRAAGGRAAAYDEDSLVLDEIAPAVNWLAGIRERFAAEAERQARALRGLGVDARVGELAGEYCPGPFSVNARGAVKLTGAAQRLKRGAWLCSTVVVIDGSERLRAVLVEVYSALGLDWDQGTVGSVAGEVPGLTVAAVQAALLREYGELIPGALPAGAIGRARQLLGRHRVPGERLGK